MLKSLQYDLLVRERCRCGGQLVADGLLFVCDQCMRVCCPECGTEVVKSGTCFVCTVCGWGEC